jgi:FkbM family methyltransferase
MRNLIRKLLNTVGYDIIKVNQYTDDKAHKIKKVQVGKFVIDMPGNNVQIGTYKYRPEANSLLGTLAAYVGGKYPGMTVVDIGANVGDTIAIIKSAIDVPIIGIEGDAVSFKFLANNTKQFQHVTVLQQFLGDKKQTLHVELEKSGWNTTLIPTENKGQELSLKTLDQLLDENQSVSQNIKVLKIDCEGFDTIILRGANELLAEQKPVVFFEYNKTNMEAINEDGFSTLLSMERYGYRSVIFFDLYGRYVLTTPISNHELIKQLHDYSDDNISRIGYYDVCLFHDNDRDLEKEFIAAAKK